MKGTLVALSLAVASALQPGSLRVRASAHATPRRPAVVAVSSWYDAGTRLEEKAPPTSGVQFTDLRPTPILEEPTQAKGLCPAPKLGIIRLDYNYTADPGDMDYPGSFPYQVVYRVVPGFSFDMVKAGKMTDEVEARYKDAIKYLEAEGVSGITGGCGFMMYFQRLTRKLTKLPVYMSSLCQLPSVTCCYGQTEEIAIFTSNGKSLAKMRDIIRDEWGVDTEEERYIIVGCENIPHFGDEVRDGDKVDTDLATPGVVQKALDIQKANPDIRAFLFECTELPQFSNAVRAATDLPVYDAMTMSDSFMSGVMNNKRFGKQDWQEEFDGKQGLDYKFGDNLTDAEKEELESTKLELPGTIVANMSALEQDN